MYQNQNDMPSFPSSPNQLVGPPSFTSENKFIIPAEVSFTHIASATGSPDAFVGTGLPGGLLLNPVDGNLSGIPATAGTYQPNLRAVYADGTQATQSYEIEVLAGPPEIVLSSPQRDSASSLQIPFEVTATGGDDPAVWVLADTVDQGTDLYKWKYRFNLGLQSLGTSSTTIGGLAPDQSYYIHLYAYNSAGEDWTGKEFFIRTQPEKSRLPFGLSMWFDAENVSGTGTSPSAGMEIATWVDLSGNQRHMNNVNGDPTIIMDGYEGRAVVDFDRNDQLISTYDFAGTDLQVWRNGGYTAFGFPDTRVEEAIGSLVRRGKTGLWGITETEMVVFTLTVGCMLGTLLIPNSISGKLNRRGVVIMEIHIALYADGSRTCE